MDHYTVNISKYLSLLGSQTVFIPPQMPGIPPMPPMPMPPMPPGMGMLQAMSMMPGGPPPPGMHMGMEPPGLPPPGLSQDDQLKMAQQRAAIVLQQEERAKQQVRVVSLGGLYVYRPYISHTTLSTHVSCLSVLSPIK